MTAAVAALLFSACGEGASESKQSGDKKNKTEQRKDQKSAEELQKEVMDIHDEYMPKMDDIHELESELDKLIAEKNEKEEQDGIEIAELEQIKKQLEMAGERMMDWMHNFKKPGEDMPEDEVSRYLEKQKDLMNEVGNSMDEAISKADSVVSKNK